jgi:hypothetical protein
VSARVVNGAIRWYDEVGVVVRAGAVDVHVAPPEQVAEQWQERDRVADLFGAASSPAGAVNAAPSAAAVSARRCRGGWL